MATETEDSFDWFDVWWLEVELQCVLLKNDSSHQSSIYPFQMKKLTLSVKHNVAQFATDYRGVLMKMLEWCHQSYKERAMMEEKEGLRHQHNAVQ